MPKVMMISGVGNQGQNLSFTGSPPYAPQMPSPQMIPRAGAYRPPLGRMLNMGGADLQGADLQGDRIRTDLLQPHLRGVGVGAMQIPGVQYTHNTYIPGAMSLPMLRGLGDPRIPAAWQTANSYIPGAASLPMLRGLGELQIPGARATRNTFIPGAMSLPMLRGHLGDPQIPGPGATSPYFIPGARSLPTLRGPAIPAHWQRQNTAIPGAMSLPMLRGLGRAGLGTPIDPCTDPGWLIANGIVGAAGNIMGAVNTASTPAGGTPDQGWAAASGAITGTSAGFQRACAQMAAIRAQQQNTVDPMAQAALQAQYAAAQQAALNAANQPKQIINGVPNAVTIGGGLAALGAIAWAFFR